MTDNDIKKALECCSEKNCKNCPCFDENIECGENLIKQALDLINRQQAEIERLEKGELRKAMTFNSETIKSCTHEAIKDFAEKIKQVLELNDLEEYNYVCKLLDILVKEMTEQSVNYGSSKTEGVVK